MGKRDFIDPGGAALKLPRQPATFGKLEIRVPFFSQGDNALDLVGNRVFFPLALADAVAAPSILARFFLVKRLAVSERRQHNPRILVWRFALHLYLKLRRA